MFARLLGDVGAHKSARVHLGIEVSVGNRLIITVAPPFIIFIEMFFFPPRWFLSPAVAMWMYACVCVCVPHHVR